MYWFQFRKEFYYYILKKYLKKKLKKKRNEQTNKQNQFNLKQIIAWFSLIKFEEEEGKKFLSGMAKLWHINRFKHTIYSKYTHSYKFK